MGVSPAVFARGGISMEGTTGRSWASFQAPLRRFFSGQPAIRSLSKIAADVFSLAAIRGSHW